MSSTSDWRHSWRRRAEVRLISGLGYPVLAALGHTYRFAVRDVHQLEQAWALGRPIHAFWHGRILPATIYFRRRKIVVITSENFDGEWIARIITRFGYGTARGSSSRGAAKAMRQLLRDVRDKPVAFTVDGPRGPARIAQPGAVWLSKATGNPVLPFHIEADRGWTLRSWDRALVPKPFSRVAVAFGAPFVVPDDADAASLETWRVHLEAALAGCERTCRAILAEHHGADAD